MSTLEETRLVNAYAWVTAAYRALEKQKDFVARPQQLELSNAVARSFIDLAPLAAEAPTGTGKTLAYLIGALAATETSGLPTKEPIVVSTATKALQQQLISNDLPRMAAAGLISLNDVAIAKGKGNYLCLKQAEETLDLVSRAGSDPDLFMDSDAELMDITEIEPIVDAFLQGKWEGDFDVYEGRRPKSVRSIAVSSDTCTKKKCEHYKDCAFYRARAKMTTAKILISNHDLLLIDLWLTSMDIEPTLPIANYLVVFDEAHHLPEKAIRVGSYEAQLSGLALALPKLGGVQRIIKGSPELEKLVVAANLKVEDFDRGPAVLALQDLTDMLDLIDVDEDSGFRRFPKGKLPPPIESSVKIFQSHLSDLACKLDALCKLLRESNALPDALAEKARELLRRALDVKKPSEEAAKCFFELLSGTRIAAWLFKKDKSITLNTAPLEGADVLNRLLWNNPRTTATVMVSATLRDLGGFDRFKKRSGLPSNARFQVLPFSFPYDESELIVAGMEATPKMAERKLFLPELAVKLPLAINPGEGTLILFPSWTMLKQFAPKLKSHFGDQKVRVQGEQPVPMMVRDHCAAINKGMGSILVGVATLSEGLDLPGKYCTHVIVIALPFAVPSDPVEQELSEILGSKYFGERSLPDAMVKLTQMVGRLLRRESDRGRVTIFDRRLASTSYGRQMLKALPPFRKVVEPLPA